MSDAASLFRGHLLSPVSPERVQSIPDGALVVDSAGRISAVGEAEELLAGHPGLPVEDLRPRLLIPGLIDAHAHLPQYDVVAMEGHELLPWLTKYVFPAEAAFADADHAREAARRFFREMLLNGTTSGAVYGTVHQEATSIAFEEAERAGLRVVLGKVMMDRNSPPELLEETETSLRESEELCSTWHGRDGRLFYAFSPRFAPTCSRGLLAETGELARRHDAHVQTHLAENLSELEWVARLFPEASSYTDVYARAGLLGPRTILAHGIHLSEPEFDLLAESGSRICHCPRSNFFLKSGTLDLARAVNRGIGIALGTDVGAGPSLSMLREMAAACTASKARFAVERFLSERLAGLAPQFEALGVAGRALHERVREALELGDEVTVVDPVRAFYYATMGGAEALGLADRIGSLSAGKEADFVTVDIASLDPSRKREVDRPPEDILSQLVYRGDRQAVAGVWVRGRRLTDDSRR